MRMTRDQAAIKLDFDDVKSPPMANVERLLRRAGYVIREWNPDKSPSGNGWHVIVHVSPRPKCPYEVVALQAILGGDANREAMQMHRARTFVRSPKFMRDAWNVLYAPHSKRIRRLSLTERETCGVK